MEERLIEWETARLAKDLGLDYEYGTAYFDKSKEPILICWNNNSGLTNEQAMAYPQHYVQKWLRDEHGQIVYIRPEFWEWGVVWNVAVYKWDIQQKDYVTGTGLYGDNGEFKTYEDALEFGLIEALKLITEK